MVEGSIYIVLHFPKDFPNGINQKTEVISSLVGKATFNIFTFSDGHFQLIVQENGKIYSEFESQKVRFLSDSDCIITYIWSASQKKFEINKHCIGTILTKEVLVIPNENPAQDFNQIIDVPSSDYSTGKWGKWRNERFINLSRTIKPDRREKSELEQVGELNDVTQTLEHNYNDWLSGKEYLIINLLSLLRSLLCHKIIEKNFNHITYNPLLFRVAAFKSQSLPIYAMPVNTQIPKNILDISDNTLYHIIVNEATIERKSKVQIVMDFQEWINGEVIITFKDRNPIYYSVNDLLLESSNTIGGSHFDPDIPIKVDFLKNLSSFDMNLIKRIVSNTVQVSIFISKYLISLY